jgi:tetratricopeptide (TPR) repeat protein
MSAKTMQIQEASAHFSAGNLTQAKTICDEILRVEPDNAEALHLSGIISAQTNDFPGAAELVWRAADQSPSNPTYFSSLGNIFLSAGQPEKAILLYDRAVELNPDYAQAHSNRGNALSVLGRMDEALQSYDMAIHLMPEHAEGHCNRAKILTLFQRYPEALGAYDAALASKPDYADAHIHRGHVLRELDQLDAALTSYSAAIEVQPDQASAWVAKGIALQQLNRPLEAIESYSAALSIDANHIQANFNLGVAYAELKQSEAAVASFERAIAIQPDYVDAHINLGNELLELQLVDAAMACYDRALELAPDTAEVQWNKALTLLMQGNLGEGWRHYQWRWKLTEFMASSLGAGIPLWHAHIGRPKHLYVWAEQGVGDEIMFGALLPQSLQLASAVTVHMDARLAPLFQRSMPHIDIAAKQAVDPASDFDARLPMGSLARIFCNSHAAIAALPSPYLKADATRSADIRSTLRGTGAGRRPLICGLSWISSNTSTGPERSIALESLVTALSAEGVRFVSLQYGDVDAEISNVQWNLQTRVVQVKSVDNFQDLDGLAALVDACDLVVSIDNSTAHLAGALGKPTWLLLPFAANWRWMLDSPQTPWYPSVTLHRQTSPGDWGPIFNQLRSDLERLL